MYSTNNISRIGIVHTPSRMEHQIGNYISLEFLHGGQADYTFDFLLNGKVKNMIASQTSRRTYHMPRVRVYYERA